MKERPILFNGPMVRAILDGRKTQTRRVVKPQPEHKDGGYFYPNRENWKVGWAAEDSVAAKCDPNFTVRPATEALIEAGFCPFGKPGDHLWVRETHAIVIDRIEFRTDYPEDNWQYQRWEWTPSIHMKREYSRITLEVTDVRVERLQDISEEDARAEGVDHYLVNGTPSLGCMGVRDPRKYSLPEGCWESAFLWLWDSINAKRGHGWDTNPLVWVVEFKRIEP